MRRIWSRIVSGGAAGPLAALLLVLILALQYLSGLLTLGMANLSKERDLGEHLLDLGRLAPEALGRPALSLADLAFDAQWQEIGRLGPTSATSASAFYRAGLEAYLTEPFNRFARQARLNKLVLLAEDGRVLFDTLAPQRLLEHYDFWEIDSAEIQGALRGEALVTPFYTGPQGVPVKRCYLPMRDGDPRQEGGRVRGVLCLWAGKNYLGGIGVLGRNLLRLNLVLTVLMGLVGLLIYSLIRRQRRFERQAAEADRLAGLGSLAAGFAHELRNPLEIVRAFAEDLERGLRGGAPAAEVLDACADIIEEVDRMNRLVGQFLSYSRGRAGEGPGGVTAVLETTQSVLAMLRPSADKAQVTLRLEWPGAVEEAARRWTVALDSGAFRQVLINLALNAIQASRPGGVVILAIAAGTRAIDLSVADQGGGIPENDRHRIFEPFFSTRPGGSGLGLAISRQIADRAGGSLKLVGNKAGQGACFTLSLPRAADQESIAECGLRIAECGLRIEDPTDRSDPTDPSDYDYDYEVRARE